MPIPMPLSPSRLLALLLCIGTVLGITACQRADNAPQPPAAPAAKPVEAARTPAQAVTVLVERLRARDGVGLARVALPPALHAQVQQAWRDGRSHWPLDELPLEERLPKMLAALAKPGAEATLDATFRRQFAGADADIDEAIRTLAQFGSQYVRSAPQYGAAERKHWLQLIDSTAHWAKGAPLADRKRAQRLFGRLAPAARRTGIDHADDYRQLGMSATLERIAPFLGTLADAFAADYGLNLDAALASVRAEVVEQAGERARVRVRYVLAGTPIDIVLAARRIDGRWYLQGLLERAAQGLPPGT